MILRLGQIVDFGEDHAVADAPGSIRKSFPASSISAVSPVAHRPSAVREIAHTSKALRTCPLVLPASNHGVDVI
jgi:hypothetical protein